MGITEFLKNFPFLKKEVEPTIEFIGPTIVCSSAEKTYFELNVETVKEVFTFKRDLGTVDLICLGFRINSEGTFYEIDEEMPGFSKFKSQLPEHFIDIKDDWFGTVMEGPFKTNLRSIWGEALVEKLWET